MSAPANAKPAPTVYYRDRQFLVTSSKVKSPTKTYRTDKIEKVSLRRDPYYIALAFTGLFALFLMRFGFLFSRIPFLYLLLAIWITYLAKQYSLLFVTSKAVSELAFIGQTERLIHVREGIERAMHKEDSDEGDGHDEDEKDDEDDDDD